MKIVYKIAIVSGVIGNFILYREDSFESYQEALNYMMENSYQFEKEINYTILPIITKNQ